MADIIAEIMAWLSVNWLFIMVVIGGFAAIIWYFGKPKGEEKYKKLDIEKEIKRHLAATFSLTEENIGYGKTLYIGSRNAGFILKSIYINQYEKLTDTVRIAKLKAQADYAKEFIEESNKDLTVMHKMMGFQVCKKGRISQILAQLGFGVEYFLIEVSLVSETETSFNINPYSQPIKSCGVWIFSNTGRVMVDEIAYKISDEQRLETLINTIPRSLFLTDLDHAKDKSGFDMLEDVRRAKRQEELERIKKE